MKEGKKIEELIGYWNEYSQERLDTSVQGFAKWLNLKTQPSTDPLVEKKSARIQLGYLFGRLVNYSELWTKIAFRDLPIKRFEEYGILRTIEMMGDPSKNTLAESLLLEKSTVFEIIKRLVRKGFLLEKKDAHDKRITRIQLSKKGIQLLEQAGHMAMKISEFLFGDLTDQEIDMLLSKFKELDQFHFDHYKRREEISF